MLLKTPPPWFLPDRHATPEPVFQNRRELIRRLAAAGVASALAPAVAAVGSESPKKRGPGPSTKDLYPARRNERYVLDGPPTPERIVSRYNVFDEFSVERGEVWKSASRFVTDSWRIQVGGAVEKPLQFDADELIRQMGVE